MKRRELLPWMSVFSTRRTLGAVRMSRILLRGRDGSVLALLRFPPKRRGKPGKTAKAHDGDLDRTCVSEAPGWCEGEADNQELQSEEEKNESANSVAGSDG